VPIIILSMTNTDIINEIDFSFCPVCAGKIERRPPKLLTCKNCDKEFYINARPCNAVIITDNQGRVLLTKRKFDPGMGLWDLPGGFIDLEESAEESVNREMQEELGVKVKNIKCK
jgi:NADH pyrophosphatase NudC (nudix superfamily)